MRFGTFSRLDARRRRRTWQLLFAFLPSGQRPLADQVLVAASLPLAEAAPTFAEELLRQPMLCGPQHLSLAVPPRRNMITLRSILPAYPSRPQTPDGCPAGSHCAQQGRRVAQACCRCPGASGHGPSLSGES